MQQLAARRPLAPSGSPTNTCDRCSGAAEADQVIARTPCQRITLPRLERPQVEPLPTDRARARGHARTVASAGAADGRNRDPAGRGGRSGRGPRRLPPARPSGWTGSCCYRPATFGPPKTESSFAPCRCPGRRGCARGAPGLVPPGAAMPFTKPDGGPGEPRPGHTGRSRGGRVTGAPRRTRLHDLRHYYASLLIRHGESVKVVQASATRAQGRRLDTYSHLWPDSEELTRAAVDESSVRARADSVRTAALTLTAFRRSGPARRPDATCGC